MFVSRNAVLEKLFKLEVGKGWVSLIASLVFWLHPSVFQRGFISVASKAEYQGQKMQRVEVK